MTASGTTAFAPTIGELLLNAFARIQVRSPALTQDHLVNARMESNLLQAQWSNAGVNLWTVDLQTTTLVQGTASYTVEASTVMILDAYVSTGTTTVTDRFISPISRTEYASQPNKAQQAPPTSYWFDRLIAPTITLWPVPDGNGPYTLKYYRYRQIQDAEYAGGLTPEVPYLFLDAWAAGLAHRLARFYAPELEVVRKADAMEAWGVAANQNVENVPTYFIPGLSGYYR